MLHRQISPRFGWIPHKLRALWHRLAHTERGSNLVELALCLPILLLMLAGTVDTGLGYHDYIVMTNGVREAARYGSTRPSDTAGILNRLTTAVSQTNSTITAMSVEFPNGHSAGQPIRVRVEYTRPLVLGSILGIETLTMVNAVDMMIQ